MTRLSQVVQAELCPYVKDCVDLFDSILETTKSMFYALNHAYMILMVVWNSVIQMQIVKGSD